GGVDDPAVHLPAGLLGLGAPVGGRIAGQQEMTAQVHRDDGVPVLIGHVEQHLVAGDPGVVHDDAQSAQVVGGLNQFVGGGPLADVAGDRHPLGAGGGDLV